MKFYSFGFSIDSKQQPNSFDWIKSKEEKIRTENVYQVGDVIQT